MSIATSLPDLLRRFVATPYRFEEVLQSTVVALETNDQGLLTGFRVRAEELAGVLASPSDKYWYWKVIRDYDVFQEDHHRFLLDDETTSTLFLGTGTVVAIDWQRDELLGFVAAGISTQCLVDALIDLATRHHLNNEANLL
jgi:hypothetical protein